MTTAFLPKYGVTIKQIINGLVKVGATQQEKMLLHMLGPLWALTLILLNKITIKASLTWRIRTAIMNKPPLKRLTLEQQAQHEIANLRAYSSAMTFAAIVVGIAVVVMAFEILTMRDMIAGIC
jgi:hypothetical protein